MCVCVHVLTLSLTIFLLSGGLVAVYVVVWRPMLLLCGQPLKGTHTHSICMYEVFHCRFTLMAIHPSLPTYQRELMLSYHLQWPQHEVCHPPPPSSSSTPLTYPHVQWNLSNLGQIGTVQNNDLIPSVPQCPVN